EEKSDFHDIKTNQNGNTIISDKKFHLMTKPYPKGPVKKQTQPLSQMEKFKEFEEIHPPLKTKSLPIRNPLLKSSKAT
ncbi:MAG: hypothetical protein U9N59_08735, partial [Campylobacterota bacterium]|nr:hypothetical protein [Campylobacterota bacterium]